MQCSPLVQKTSIRKRSSCETNLAVIIQMNTFPKNGANTLNESAPFSSDIQRNIPNIWWIFLSGSDRQDYYAHSFDCIDPYNQIPCFIGVILSLWPYIHIEPETEFEYQITIANSKSQLTNLFHASMRQVIKIMSTSNGTLSILFRFIFSWSCQSLQVNSIERKYKQQVHARIFFV